MLETFVKVENKSAKRIPKSSKKLLNSSGKKDTNLLSVWLFVQVI